MTTLDTTNLPPSPFTADVMKTFGDALEAAGLPREHVFHKVNSASGNILSAAYHPESRRMLVVFSGYKDKPPSLYEIGNVEPEKYGNFAMTFPDKGSSTGAHFSSVFRNKPEHPARRLA